MLGGGGGGATAGAAARGMTRLASSCRFGVRWTLIKSAAAAAVSTPPPTIHDDSRCHQAGVGAAVVAGEVPGE